MKKFIPLLMLLLVTAAAPAQPLEGNSKKSDKTEYCIGKVPVVNGKVIFEEKLQAKGSSAEILAKAQQWIEKRFSNEGVIKFKKYDSETPGTLTVKSEEYITFSKKFFVLDRTRITYFLDITAQDNGCTMKMYRITYWYDEEYKGGQHFTAEEYITDDQAFNKKKTKMLKIPGKFRKGTIDLKNNIKQELEQAIN